MREPFVFIRSLFGLRAGLNLSIKALEQRLTSRTNLLRILVHENGIESANTLFFLSGSVRLSRLKMAKRKVLYFRKRKHKIVKKKGKLRFLKLHEAITISIFLCIAQINLSLDKVSTLDGNRSLSSAWQRGPEDLEDTNKGN